MYFRNVIGWLLALNGLILVAVIPVTSMAIGAGKLAVMSVSRDSHVFADGPGQDERTREWIAVTNAINATAFRYLERLKYILFCIFLANVLGCIYLLIISPRQIPLPTKNVVGGEFV
jgi:hypothetical protein